MIELNCETDFVAKTDEFRELGHEICMQVAAAAPQYIKPEDVPQEVLDREKEIFRQQALDEGKPENIVDRIAEGKLNKFYENNCLMEQVYIRDGDKKIKDLLVDHIARLGENMVIGNMSRFAIGE
jgi:elongation factor Ts